MEGNKVILTQSEANFCLLYVHGTAPYSGNASKCYIAVYGSPENCPKELADAMVFDKASRLLDKPEVRERIEELRKHDQFQTAVLKQRINSPMLAIMEECSEQRVYKNRFKEVLMPAPMRAVAIQAAKVLQDINGLKEDSISKLQITNGQGEGITFNLIVPNKEDKEEGNEV